MSVFSLAEYQQNLSITQFDRFNKNLKVAFRVSLLGTPLIGSLFLFISYWQLSRLNRRVSEQLSPRYADCLTFYGHLVGFGLSVFAWSILVCGFAVYCLTSPSAAFLFSGNSSSESAVPVGIVDMLFYVSASLLFTAVVHLHLVKRIFILHCRKLERFSRSTNEQLESDSWELSMMRSSRPLPPQSSLEDGGGGIRSLDDATSSNQVLTIQVSPI